MAEKTNVPEIRFAGFTDPWEQRKLSDIGEVITGSTPSTQHPEYYSEDGIPWVTPTDIVDNIIHDTPRKLSPLGEKVGRVVPANTILVTCIASIGKNTMLANIGSFNQQINGLVPNKKKYDSYFLLTESFHWSSKMKREAAAGTMQIVNKNEFSAIDTYVPEWAEQKAIGDYFRNIDNLIALHQRECDKLAQLKKSMLDQMFPKPGERFPEIRFAGFTAPWEQRKLGDEAIEMVAGGDIDKSLLDEHGQYPVIANALTGDGIVGYYAKVYRIKAPAVTVTGRGDVGHAKARIVDFTPVVRLLSVRSEHNVFFLENAINTLNIRIESTGVPQLTVPQLSQYEIFFPPTVEEEKEIGVFFERIDNLITLHQRKLELLRNTKKSLLDRMFV